MVRWKCVMRIEPFLMEVYKMEWWQDLCEYYNVPKEKAIELGVRKTGRRPDFPSSRTCNAVGGKNMEEWWDLKERHTLQQKMNFYKDIGAWLTFRQCNYRSNFNYGKYFSSYIKPGCSVVEYGCGVAPFINYLVERPDKFDIGSMKFNIVDVVSEPLEFANWRLRKKCPEIDLTVHRITEEYLYPKFNDMFDVICIMDVFEHLPNPYSVVENLMRHSNIGCVLVETWVDKSDGKHGGPDLEEAENEKKETIELLNNNFPIKSNGSIRVRVRK